MNDTITFIGSFDTIEKRMREGKIIMLRGNNVRKKTNHSLERKPARVSQKTIHLLLLFFTFFCGNAAVAQNNSGPKLTIVSPPNGAFITEKKVYLAGTVTGSKAQQVIISGKNISVKESAIPIKEGTFAAHITFKEGKNEIVVNVEGVTQTVNVFFRPKKAKKDGAKIPEGYKEFYIHASPSALNCRECHTFRRGKFNFKRIIPARSDCTTAECHPKLGKDAPHVHGPVGAGICISCHNPHGSFQPLQLERTGQELCLDCHEAKREEFNQAEIHPPVEDGCIDCHDPHQSQMRFQLRGNSKQVSSLCYQCHEQEIFTKEHQHGPVETGDCIACHFPHASANKHLLIAPKDKGKLCFECHDTVQEQMGRKVLHDPVAEDCNNCHEPHSADSQYQLKAPMEQLCESCHQEISPQIYESINKAKYNHEPVANGECTECHLAHGSEVVSLLKGKGIQLCGSCHIELGEEITESKNQHGPVKTGACSECHNVHGSQFSRLLVRKFPDKFYNDYEAQDYDLCFGCHNKDVAKTRDTTELTSFRDETYNLHYFHVNRKKGRNCIACHDAHASSQNKHIRYEVPFGKWSYPMEFTMSKTGGGCIVGCHIPKKYDRQKAQGKPSR